MTAREPPAPHRAPRRCNRPSRRCSSPCCGPAARPVAPLPVARYGAIYFLLLQSYCVRCARKRPGRVQNVGRRRINQGYRLIKKRIKKYGKKKVRARRPVCAARRAHPFHLGTVLDGRAEIRDWRQSEAAGQKAEPQQSPRQRNAPGIKLQSVPNTKTQEKNSSGPSHRRRAS